MKGKLLVQGLRGAGGGGGEGACFVVGFSCLSGPEARNEAVTNLETRMGVGLP